MGHHTVAHALVEVFFKVIFRNLPGLRVDVDELFHEVPLLIRNSLVNFFQHHSVPQGTAQRFVVYHILFLVVKVRN